jgi:hypothetical protein
MIKQTKVHELLKTDPTSQVFKINVDKKQDLIIQEHRSDKKER